MKRFTLSKFEIEMKWSKYGYAFIGEKKIEKIENG